MKENTRSALTIRPIYISINFKWKFKNRSDDFIRFLKRLPLFLYPDALYFDIFRLNYRLEL